MKTIFCSSKESIMNLKIHFIPCFFLLMIGVVTCTNYSIMTSGVGIWKPQQYFCAFALGCGVLSNGATFYNGTDSFALGLIYTNRDSCGSNYFEQWWFEPGTYELTYYQSNMAAIACSAQGFSSHQIQYSCEGNEVVSVIVSFSYGQI